MKLFFSEFLNDYSTYTFSYAVYCLKENADEVPSIYRQGFLPFTARLDFQKDIFYLARSVRINLENFSDTSENRRVDRMIGSLDKIEIALIPKADFNLKDPDFISFCLSFAGERFSGGNMNEQRLNYLLSRENLTHIITFRSAARTYAYLLTHISAEIMHYWFAFYDTAFINYSLGKWLMWKTISLAKEQGRQYIYLGTCYTPKGLYKVRDHKGAEFFDGRSWNPDLKLLKQLCENDLGEPNPADLFKLNSFANQIFYNL